MDKSLTYIAKKLLCGYQYTLSPDMGLLSPWLSGTVCSHTPHCSKYAQECLFRYGFVRSISEITERIFSCGPSNTMHYDPSAYRVVFASGAPIGKSFLKGLVDDPRFDVVGVLTMPDAKSGRGMKYKENTLATYAKHVGIDEATIHKPHSLRSTSKKWGNEAKETKQRLQDSDIDFLVVVAYGKILPKEILEIPHFGPINVHGSILPKYRGSSPLQSVFLKSEKTTGVTIMYMDEGVDTGDIIDIKKIVLPLSRTVKDLIQWIEKSTPKFLCDTLREFGKGRIDRILQDNSLATHTSKITKKDGLIGFSDSLQSVYRKYQAYALRPKIYFEYNGNTITIEEILLESTDEEDSFTTAWCSEESLQLHDDISKCIVKPAGKNSMTRESFVHGYRE